MGRIKGKNAIISKRFVITLLLIISFVMTSSTFAYWAGIVEGAETDVTNRIIVGLPIYNDHSFVLNSKVSSYRYEIDLEQLLQDPSESIDEVVFGIIWDDEDLDDDLKNQILAGEITVNYELIIMKNNKEVNNNKYRRYSKLINIDIDESNPNQIEYKSNPETYRFNISLNEEQKRNDYKNLLKHQVYIEISFQVDVDE